VALADEDYHYEAQFGYYATYCREHWTFSGVKLIICFIIIGASIIVNLSSYSSTQDQILEQIIMQPSLAEMMQCKLQYRTAC